MKRILPLILLLSFSGLLEAQSQQDKQPYKHKREVFVDATAILGNVLSLNTSETGSPYGFGVRFHGKKMSWRISGNTKSFSQNTTDFNGTNFISKSLFEQDHSLRVGFEFNTDVAKNFKLLYGIDVLGGYRRSDSSLDDDFGLNVFQRIDQDFIIGAGPAIRLEYRISDRFFIMTESTFYFKGFYTYDEFKLGSDPVQSSDGFDYEGGIRLPNSIIFSVAF